jgi:hypothetical protein
VFAISLAVRLLVWWGVEQAGVPPVFDENTYLVRAVGYENLIRTHARDGWFSAEHAERDARRAYFLGGWPPLHPFLVGVAFFFAERSVELARGVVLVQSAITTALVFMLTRRISPLRGAAWAAALIHASYPSFVAYSHLLWSETTYILVLLAAVYFAVRAADAVGAAGALAPAALCGVALGLAGLTRAAVIPILLFVPVWLAWRLRPPRRGLLAAGIAVLTCVATITPWVSTLWKREGRLVPLATSGGYNLYLGNNPWSDESDPKPEMHAAIDEEMRRCDSDQDTAARRLAVAHISAQPGQFVYRCYKRLVALWQPDKFLYRHFVSGFYPPQSSAATVGIWLAFCAGFFVLIAAAAAGIASRRGALRHRDLLILCLVLGALPNVLTLATTRMSLPLLALLLPAAGVGLARLCNREAAPRAALGGALALGVLAALYIPVRKDMRWLADRYSARFAPLIETAAARFGGRTGDVVDRLVFRARDASSPVTYRIELLTDGYVFETTGGWRRDWSPAQENAHLALLISATRPELEQPRVRITPSPDGRTVELDVVGAAPWRAWTPTGIPGLEFIWLGARAPLDEEVAYGMTDTGADRPFTAE